MIVKRQEFWALNWLRFFLALYIVLFHTLNGPYELNKTHPVISALLSLGNFATSIFFVLSGFLLTYVYVTLRGGQKIDRRSFLVSRLSALYPIHLFTLVLALPLFFAALRRHGGVVVPLDVSWAATRLLGNGEATLGILMNLTLTQAWNPLYMLLNVPAWSLSTLLFFYLLFPYTAPALNRMRNPVAGLIGFGVLFLLPGAYAEMAGLTDLVTDGILHRNPIVRLPLFLAGVLLCVIYARRVLGNDDKPGMMEAVWAGGVITLTIAFATYWPLEHPGRITPLIRNGLYFPAALAVVWILARLRPAASGWNQRWSARLGKVSLSIFALHYPLFDLVYRGEKIVRAYIRTFGEHKSLSELLQTARTLDENISFYPVYLVLVIVASIAMQERIVNPVQASIKRRYFAWQTGRTRVQQVAEPNSIIEQPQVCR